MLSLNESVCFITMVIKILFNSNLLLLFLPMVQVKDLLREKSSFKNQEDWVTVLDGTQEGTYEWV